jgi:RIO-like serine/threonine protein kinase
MRNVTITLEEEVARWARIKAAELDTSVSRLVGEMLREKMMSEQSYQLAMQRYLSRQPRRVSEPKIVYPSREELHER